MSNGFNEGMSSQIDEQEQYSSNLEYNGVIGSIKQDDNEPEAGGGLKQKPPPVLGALTAANLRETALTAKPNLPYLKRNSKANSLLDFLDKAENEAEEELRSVIASSVKDFPCVPRTPVNGAHSYTNNSNDDCRTVRSVSSQVFDGIRAKMVGMKVKLEDREKTMGLLKKTVSKMKTKKKQMQNQHRKEIRRLSETHKKEQETAAARQLSFVDRLLADKEKLANKCDELAQSVTKLRSEFEGKLEAVGQKHRVQMARAKEQWSAAERVRRERWIKTKTASIKEMTIKGLEPEINNLIQKQKLMSEEAETNKQQALLKQKQVLFAEHQEEIERIRKALDHRRSEAIAQEQEECQKKLDALRERHNEELRKKLDSLQATWNMERSQHGIEISRMSAKFEQELQAAKELNNKHVELLKKASEEELEAEKRRCRIAISQVEEQCQIQREQWQIRMQKKLQAQLQVKEDAIRENLKAQQKELLERLSKQAALESEEKSQQAKEQAEQTTKEREAKHDEQVKKLKKEICDWMEKYRRIAKAHEQLHNELITLRPKAQRYESESHEYAREVAIMSRSVSQLEDKIAKMELAQKDELKKASKASRVHTAELERTISDLTRKLELAESKADDKLQDADRRHTEELNRVEARVRQALCRKDEVLTELQNQLQAKELRLEETENLLNAHRTDLMSVLGE